MESSKILDIEGVRRRLEGDMDLYQEVVRIFFENFPQSLIELRAAAAAQNATQFGHAGHSCKGALGNIGAVRAREKAFELEKAGKAVKLLRAAEMITELENEVAAFKAEYEKVFVRKA